METRMGKNKRRVKENRIKKLKILIVLLFTVLLMLGMIRVNNTIKEFGYLENSELISYDSQNNIFNFLGQSYYLDLEILKKH